MSNCRPSRQQEQKAEETWPTPFGERTRTWKINWAASEPLERNGSGPRRGVGQKGKENWDPDGSRELRKLTSQRSGPWREEKSTSHPKRSPSPKFTKRMEEGRKIWKVEHISISKCFTHLLQKLLNWPLNLFHHKKEGGALQLITSEPPILPTPIRCKMSN